MLVITRREKDQISIQTPEGRTITLTVRLIRKAQVRIGVDCDREVLVKRMDKPEFKHLSVKEEEC